MSYGLVPHAIALVCPSASDEEENDPWGCLWWSPSRSVPHGTTYTGNFEKVNIKPFLFNELRPYRQGFVNQLKH